MATTTRRASTTDPQAHLRRELDQYLERAHAHAPLARAARGLTPAAFNRRLAGLPYSAWGLLEHIRRAQRDMLDFIRKPNYQAMEWPGDYWPPAGAKATRAQWQQALRACEADRKALRRIVANPNVDLHAPIPHGEGQTVLREVLQVIDHTSYHTGQLFVLRRLLGAEK